MSPLPLSSLTHGKIQNGDILVPANPGSPLKRVGEERRKESERDTQTDRQTETETEAEAERERERERNETPAE